MVAALKFFTGTDPIEEKKSDDSDSDVSSFLLFFRNWVEVINKEAIGLYAE